QHRKPAKVRRAQEYARQDSEITRVIPILLPATAIARSTLTPTDRQIRCASAAGRFLPPRSECYSFPALPEERIRRADRSDGGVRIIYPIGGNRIHLAERDQC